MILANDLLLLPGYLKDSNAAAHFVDSDILHSDSLATLFMIITFSTIIITMINREIYRKLEKKLLRDYQGKRVNPPYRSSN